MILAMKSEQRRKMSRQEAGRKGGKKVAQERGTEFYRAIGKKGGEKVAEERGSEFYREIGRKGGESRGSRTTISKGGPWQRTKVTGKPAEQTKNVNGDPFLLLEFGNRAKS
jgi:general stress protein YciG